MVGILVRPADGQDSRQAAAVVQAVFEEYGFTWDDSEYFEDLYDLESHYLDKGHRFWIAEFNGKVVGTVGLEFFGAFPGRIGDLFLDETQTRAAGSDCSLERLYVHPGARRHGLGGLLMEQVLREARTERRKCLEIWSDKRFTDAHRLYGKFGAVQVGDRICDDPDLSPEWGLVIDLGTSLIPSSVD